MQERALFGAQAVHAAGLIEQRQAELRDLLGVRLAIAAAPAEGAEAFEHHVLAVEPAGRRAYLAPDQVGHEPVAQTARGDLHLLDAQPAHHPIEDRRSGVHDVDARLVDPQLAPLLRRRVAQPLQHALHLSVGHRTAPARRSGEPARQLGDGTGGARGPDQPAMSADQERVDVGQRVLDRLLEQPRLAPGDGIVLDEELRQADRAELQARGAVGLLSPGRDHLGRAAADVQEQRPLGGRRALQDAQADQARLFGPGDDLHRQSRGRADGPQELRAVGGLADGAGRHRADPLRPGALRELLEALQCGRASRDRVRREPSGAEDLRPQPDGRAILGAHGEGAIPAGVGDLQPDGVRAQVHHRQRDDLRAAPHPDMRKSTIEGTSGRTSTGLPEWSVSR